MAGVEGGGSEAALVGTVGTQTGQEPLTAPFAEHGGGASRGLAHTARGPASAAAPATPVDGEAGRYGRLFPDLPPFLPRVPTLEVLAASMFPGPPPPGPPPPPPPPGGLEPGENPDIVSGYTYLGQFVDHDVTYDPLSSLQRENDPNGLRSFRTPRFDLDPLYASGPIPSAYLYDQTDAVKLLVGHNSGRGVEPVDLPRNQQGRAVVPDPRNDVHVIVSQLHLAFIRFHNAVVDHLRAQAHPADDLFTAAQRLVRWHYQWLVVHEYLPLIIPADVLSDVLRDDPRTGAPSVHTRFYRPGRHPFIPVEFSVAAFRFGHSQVRSLYALNAKSGQLHILLPFADADPRLHLGGFRPLPRGFTIDWSLFFRIDGSSPQMSRRIDTNITGPFARLPVFVDPAQRSLALLNMLRGRALGLPCGQDVAEAMGTFRSNRELKLPGGTKTPLWYWLLKEAEVLEDGTRLGPTAGRIVAEVLLGMLAADPSSYLRAPAPWRPTLPAAKPREFTIVDLLRFAGVA